MAKKLKSRSPLDAAASSGFFIVNDFDRPDEERIAGKHTDGKLYYVHPSIRDVKLYHGMTPTNPTPLEDFGIRWMVDDGKFVGMLIDECRATYRDGKPRRWQGVERFSFSIQNDEWWHRRWEARIQTGTLSPVATHGLIGFFFRVGLSDWPQTSLSEAPQS